MFLLPLIVAAILIVLVAVSINIVDPVNTAVRIRLNRRIPGIYREGWHGLWDGVLPFIDRLEQFPTELKTETVTVKVLSEDNLILEIKGSFQYRVDYRFASSYMELSDETIKVGVSDAIEAELGIIAGKVKALDFKSLRREVQNIINAILRLGTPPHYCAARSPGSNKPDLFSPSGVEEVEPEDRLPFYQKNSQAIRDVLEHEEDETEDRSVIEKRYAIDIVTYALAEVGFSKETAAALEKKQQARHEADGLGERFDKKVKMMKGLKGEFPGLDDSEVLNEASVSMGQATRQVFSLEGLKKLFRG